MQTIDDVRQQQEYWENLVGRIADGDPGGAAEFRGTYRAGIRFLMQRRIGDNRLDEVVDQTMRGILGEITSARMTSVAEMARFIRKSVPAERPATGGPVITETDRERNSSRVKTLDEVLEHFSSTERDALICFYARGFSERDVEAEYGYDAVAFRHLRERLVRSLNSARARRRPATRQAGAMRTSAAGGAA